MLSSTTKQKRTSVQAWRSSNILPSQIPIRYSLPVSFHCCLANF